MTTRDGLRIVITATLLLWLGLMFAPALLADEARQAPTRLPPSIECWSTGAGSSRFLPARCRVSRSTPYARRDS